MELNKALIQAQLNLFKNEKQPIKNMLSKLNRVC